MYHFKQNPIIKTQFIIYNNNEIFCHVHKNDFNSDENAEKACILICLKLNNVNI